MQLLRKKSSNNSGFELSAMEKRHIARVLDYTNGNKTEAAKLLKIGLTTLYRKIEEYKLSNSFQNNTQPYQNERSIW